jgi:hypothetical protein
MPTNGEEQDFGIIWAGKDSIEGMLTMLQHSVVKNTANLSSQFYTAYLRPGPDAQSKGISG